MTVKPMDKIVHLAESVATNNGVRLYDLELVGAGKGKTLRVYIDKDDAAGVSLDDCSNVSRGLSLLLDVEDPIDGTYNLEVSSPGLERTLKKKWHFEISVGKEVCVSLNKHLGKIITTVPGAMASRKKLVGVLTSANDQEIEVDIGDTAPIRVPLENVAKANWVFNLEKIEKN